MPGVATKGSKPVYIAELDYHDEEQIELRDGFFAACIQFKYRHIMALSRALGIHPVTVERWKYQMIYPGDEKARIIVRWADDGMPMRYEPLCQSAGDMFNI